MAELSSRFTSPGEALSAQTRDESKLERELSASVERMLSEIGRVALSNDLTPASAANRWILAVNEALSACGWNPGSPEFDYLATELYSERLGDEAYLVALSVAKTANATYPAPSKETMLERMNEAFGLTSLVAAGRHVAEPKQKLNWKSRVASKVRTSYTGMSGYVALQAFRVARRKTKTWVTRHDDNVRSTHAALDGQTVAIEQPFESGSALLRFPGDRKGVIGEVINCRCRMISRN
jgi:hypothetical protein